MRPLRLTIDARMWRHGGIGTYLRHLVPALARSGGIDHCCVLGAPPEGMNGADGRLCRQPFSAPIYSVAEQLARPWPPHGVRLWHSPHVNIPLRWRGPLVATIHDLTHVRLPRLARSRLAAPYTAFMLRQIARRAQVIITPSEATKQELCAWTGITPDRVVVIAHGIAPAFSAPVPHEGRHRTLQRYGITPPFFLWVSAVRPHKNPILVLRAFARVKAEYRVTHQLVMVGQVATWYRAPLREAQRLGVGDAVRWVGDVPLGDLPALYQSASMLVMPSLAEGFGLPAAEAMAAGLPVVASAIPALIELIGDAGVTLPPKDLEGWVRQLGTLARDDDAAQTYRARGRARASQWTWERAAHQHLEVYRRALS